ncbi:MAG TPA: NADH-quinone oxidoreductase subunit H [Armatimonadota bacterium]|nr:NADH-quinone oxidoreductase subunit H [Armatimonadota bacterium]
MFIAGALLNVILVILLAPLFEGIVRKLKAVIHSRKGPPITQPYIDILKLLGKEDLQMGGGALFRIAPMISLGAMLLAATLTPMWGKAPLGTSGDIIVWVYIMSLSAVAVMLGAFASGNPFCYTGASREMMMLLSAEPVAVVALLTAGVKAKSLLMGDVIGWQIAHGPSMSMAFAGIAFFLALQANIGKLPFDMVEADQEIADGPFMEFSGPRLALYKLSFYIRQLVFSFILVSIFVPWPGVSFAPLALVAGLVKVLVVFVVIGLIDSVNPRLRIDQSMTYMGRVLFVSLAALAFAVIGV